MTPRTTCKCNNNPYNRGIAHYLEQHIHITYCIILDQLATLLQRWLSCTTFSWSLLVDKKSLFVVLTRISLFPLFILFVLPTIFTFILKSLRNSSICKLMCSYTVGKCNQHGVQVHCMCTYRVCDQ